MQTRTLKGGRVLTGLYIFALSGCASVPPGRITVDRMDYGNVIAESWKRQTLLNVVRLRYADAPVFLDVASVINSYTLAGSASASPTIKTGDPNEVSFGVSAAFSNTPTVTYQPLMGDRFTRSLLQPIPPSGIFQLMQGGWSAELVMRTAVMSINGVRNDSLAAAADPSFGQLVDALSRLQRAGGLGDRVETRKDGSAVILMLGERGNAERQDAVRSVRDLLRLDPGVSEIEVVYGLAARSGHEVAVVTRSMLEIMLMMGVGVDLPAPTRGRALPFQFKEQGAEAAVTPLVRVRSGTAMPADAFVGVQYRGQRYWIEDEDVASKRTFTFLMILFSLAETGQSSVAPMVTVPAR